ncbi:MAG: magnesium transporter [Candidatus Omnitrophica bacterium]|nr:magnesium transporter [Candidatus Omnitrophota bacterium]
MGKRTVSKDGAYLGKLRDLTVSPNDEICPKIRGLILERGLWRKEVALVNINDVLEFNQEIVINLRDEDIHYQREKIKFDFTLCQDILDRQVVDIDNRKVVRVNDIHLLRLDSQLFVAHMDVGLRGLVRRLGWTKGVDSIVRSMSPKAYYLTREDFIPWKNAQVLTTDRRRNILRLDIARKKLSQIPAMELAEIMEDLDIFEQLSLLRSLDEELRRRVFADLATHEKHDLIEQMDDKEAVGFLENIPADEATDLLLSLPKGLTYQLMKRMETKTAKKLRKMLGFAKDSAGGLMTMEYLSLKPEAKVKDAIQLMKDHLQYPGNIYHLYVVDGQQRLLGSTSVRQFFNEDPEKSILETCYPKRIFVRLDDGMEEIALLLEKYKFSSIPVLNEDDILQGVITTDDVMEELIAIAWKKYKEKLT